MHFNWQQCSRSLGLLVGFAVTTMTIGENYGHWPSYPDTRTYNTDQDPSLYRHWESLGSQRKYMVEWVVYWMEKQIEFTVTVETRGFVGFGLSANGRMPKADIVIGGVFPNGTSYSTDRHSTGYEEPVVDASQNWFLQQAKENGSHTTLIFSRAFKTCDDDDYEINEFGTVHLIWAYGETDNTANYHHQHRGNYPVYLLEPTFVPPALKQTTFEYSANPPLPVSPNYREELRVWTISSEVRLPPRDTTYFCSMHRGPKLFRKHHLIGFNARLTELAKRHVHHLVAYRCTAPANTTAVNVFDRFVDAPPEECYFLSQPTGQLPTNMCTHITVGWGIGGRITFYPSHMGLPLGETGPEEYYVLQVHYDNPNRLDNLQVGIDLDVFYTGNLRPNDAGLLTIGHHIPGSPSILVPPSSLAHNIFGHCGGQCTNTMLPEEGIRVAFLALHTHYSGRKIIVRHFRGNRELPWISVDDTWDSTFQTFRMLNKEVQVLPGDHLLIRCEYDSTWTNGSVVGGFSTKQEMCLTYLFHYTRLEDYSLCRSEIDEPSYWRRYLGVRNITWDDIKLDYVATSPSNRRGLSMAEISDNLVNWDIQLRRELEEDHRNLPQTNICSRNPFSNTGQLQTKENSFVVTFPENIDQYEPLEQECPVNVNSFGWIAAR